ncbi:MAG: hypothetical protein M4579_001113 [Chaenotheca gracillima]|nr:MAG: hypothetical protein M4579_001113 [Chaenotheca gracillima]
MDPNQTRAINALEPYVALSKSATSPRAAVDLIIRATSDPNTYVFAELLRTPSIQSLRHGGGDEYTPYLKVLEIFSWGTYQEYTSTPNLPPLSDAQLHKLRLLSLFPLCTSGATLSYANLQSALSLPTPRALEDLLIAATYAGLLIAKLSPLTQLVHITSIAPLRDPAPGSVLHLTKTLEAWEERCNDVLSDLESQIAAVNRRGVERAARAEAEKEETAEMERAWANKKAPASAASGGNWAGGGAAGGVGATKRAYGGVGEDGNTGMTGLASDDPDVDYVDIDGQDGDWRGGGGNTKGLRKNARAKFAGSGKRAG